MFHFRNVFLVQIKLSAVGHKKLPFQINIMYYKIMYYKNIFLRNDHNFLPFLSSGLNTRSFSAQEIC
jgi:hypothetical protein